MPKIKAARSPPSATAHTKPTENQPSDLSLCQRTTTARTAQTSSEEPTRYEQHMSIPGGCGSPRRYRPNEILTVVYDTPRQPRPGISHIVTLFGSKKYSISFTKIQIYRIWKADLYRIGKADLYRVWKADLYRIWEASLYRIWEADLYRTCQAYLYRIWEADLYTSWNPLVHDIASKLIASHSLGQV